MGLSTAASPLALALSLLERAERAPAAELVERVDVGQDGAIDLALRPRPERRWLRCERGELLEIRPADDSALPAALALGAGGALEGSRVLAWRPGRRIVIAPREAPDIVLKGYRPRRLDEAELRHRVGGEAWRAAGFDLPRLIERRSELCALAFERVEGAPLSVANDGPELFGELGRKLRALPRPAGELPLHGAAAELEVLDRWRERLALAGVEPAAGYGALRAALGYRADSLPAPEPVPCHRDLHDGQLLIGDGRTWLLDLDLGCRGDPALDPANFAVHLALRGLQGVHGATRESAAAAATAFRKGYGADAADDSRARSDFHAAASALRLSLVYALRPRWSHLAGELSALAARCLEGRQP